MKVHLPNSAFLGNIDPFLKGIDTLAADSLDITSNKKWISVHPVVLAMVAALGLNLASSRIHFDKLEAKSKHYLERMGLFSLLGITGMKIREHEPAGRFIPLTRITNSEELSLFITEMVPLLHLEPKQASSIKYVVSELVRNVLEHARSNGAVVAAQYYKKSHTIRFGIADAGVGIKETIRQSHDAKTDLEAIRLALTPGVTGTTRKEGGTESNAGAGLFFIKSIAQINREFFLIYSGSALYKLLKSRGLRISLHSDPFGDRHSERQDMPYWKGTVVGVDISLSETREFSELLDLIREVYLKTIRERKKERWKPRFI